MSKEVRHLSIDIETYSSEDITKVGAYRYCDSPDFEILLIAYSFEEDREIGIDEPYLIDLTVNDEYTDGMLEQLKEALTDPTIIKHAYNANFERTALSKYFSLEMPPEQWNCTMIHAATLGLPGSLAKVGEVLEFEEDKAKDKTGKALIQFFCGPCKPTKKNNGRTRNLPEHDMDKWNLFKEYCKQDVVSEIAVAERLAKYQMLESEKELWDLDQRINDRGVMIDIDFVRGIIEYYEKYQRDLLERAQVLTRLQNPNSGPQLIKWLKNQGIETNSVDKDNVTRIISETDSEKVKEVLKLKQEMSKTSTKKYLTMEMSVCSDSRIHGVLQFYGANRTGRWAGRLVQVHNLPQNKIPDIELARELVAEEDFETLELLFQGTPFVFSQLIRTAFIASPGNRFIISDFSAIEARVIAWLADEKWRLEVFNTHGKIYEASASQMFHVPIENIKKGSKLRQQGKIAELALGYGGGFGAIKSMDKEGSIPDDEIPMLVSNWRAANPHIVKFWYICEAAAKTAIKERREIKIQHDLRFKYKDSILFITLPSGRSLAYWGAHIGTNRKGMESILYEGVDQDTKQWVKNIETYGGKLVENIVQAVARDCLAMAMQRIDLHSYKIVMHVHDEIIIDAPKEVRAEYISEIMSEPILWAPGLPLKGDTFETPFYKKD